MTAHCFHLCFTQRPKFGIKVVQYNNIKKLTEPVLALALLLPKTWTFPVPLVPAVFLSFQPIKHPADAELVSKHSAVAKNQCSAGNIQYIERYYI